MMTFDLPESAPEATVFDIDENGVLRGYHGADRHLVLPDGITEKGGTHEFICSYRPPVPFDDMLTIENGCVLSCREEAKAVVIPDGVTEIGDHAFRNCHLLAFVVVPNYRAKLGTLVCGQTARDCVRKATEQEMRDGVLLTDERGYLDEAAINALLDEIEAQLALGNFDGMQPEGAVRLMKQIDAQPIELRSPNARIDWINLMIERRARQDADLLTNFAVVSQSMYYRWAKLHADPAWRPGSPP